MFIPAGDMHMAAPNEITPKQLLRLIGTPECPVIVDISIDPDFAVDPYLIPGSFRHPHTDIDGLLARLTGRACIITCQRGIKLSQGLTSQLRGRGIDAQFLSGGMFGWRDTNGAPPIPFAALPTTHLWVTRHRPKIDRISCPWLIRRFVNADAEFMFVAPEWVIGAADRYNATPFDVPDIAFSHVGDHCTFDAMLDAFDLRTNALNRMAQVIRAADTSTDDSPHRGSAGPFCRFVPHAPRRSHSVRRSHAPLRRTVSLGARRGG
jgi:hypothetical protein